MVGIVESEKHMSNTRELPAHYYSASNEDGTVNISRFGADNDSAAEKQLRAELRRSELIGVSLYRIDQGRPVAIKHFR